MPILSIESVPDCLNPAGTKASPALPSAYGNGLLEKLGSMLLAALAPFAQLAVYEVAFPAGIGYDRGVPIASLVGAVAPFFLRF